jgi:hypothetical protein
MRQRCAPLWLLRLPPAAAAAAAACGRVVAAGRAQLRAAPCGTALPLWNGSVGQTYIV